MEKEGRSPVLTRTSIIASFRCSRPPTEVAPSTGRHDPDNFLFQRVFNNNAIIKLTACSSYEQSKIVDFPLFSHTNWQTRQRVWGLVADLLLPGGFNLSLSWMINLSQWLENPGKKKRTAPDCGHLDSEEIPNRESTYLLGLLVEENQGVDLCSSAREKPNGLQGEMIDK